MTTRDYLRQIERMERLVDNRLAEIMKLTTLSTSITVASDSEKVQTSGSKDLMGNAVAMIVDAKEEVYRSLKVYIMVRSRIVSQIECMELRDCQVLYGKYVERQSLEDIAEKMHYSWRQIRRIHKGALERFEKQYGKEYLEKNVL